MGSNRRTVSGASLPQTTTQTHTPSGSSTCPVLTLVNTGQVKQEPVSDLDVGLSVDCHTESWAESYQDLSSWCSATSACSPAICQSPVTDENLVNESDFQGEIDFDLRKSEEIASMPLEEVGSFNLFWGPEFHQTGVHPPDQAASSTDRVEPVLLNDCWLFEQGKVAKDSSESVQPLTVTSASTATSQQLFEEVPSINIAIKKDPEPAAVLQQQLLPDSSKMADLQQRLERIASHTHPGVDSKEKGAELMKILQRQISMFNKKKYNSPAAVADLPNHQASFIQRIEAACTSATSIEPCYVCPAVTSAPSMANTTELLFQSDPFEGLFSLQEQPNQQGTQPQHTHAQSSFSPNLTTVAPALFVPYNVDQTPSTITSSSGTNGRSLFLSNVFSEAHQQVLKATMKPQQQDIRQPQRPVQLPHLVTQQQQYLQSQQHLLQQHIQHQKAPVTHHTMTTEVKKEPQASMKPRARMPELELNFDALLFGPPGPTPGLVQVPEIGTPEVLKPLVDTPDPEGFDLLSYLCDDKASTPPVALDSNPFQFPQPSTSHASTAITAERKPNVMVVKPMPPGSVMIGKVNVEQKDSAVIVQVQPQIMPSTFMEEDDDAKEVKEETKETPPSRPVRSPRKRKISEDFIVEPSEIEEVTRTGRRKRTSSAKTDSDEEFTLPVRRARKRPPIIIEDDEDEDDELVVRKRGRSSAVASSRAARSERSVSTSSESDRYRELRDRNNEASRKSRLTRKAREQELGKQAEVLTKENRILKVKVEEMESLVKKLREALLLSMMKKSDVTSS